MFNFCRDTHSPRNPSQGVQLLCKANCKAAKELIREIRMEIKKNILL